MTELYVMVLDDPRVWRLVGHTSMVLTLDTPDGLTTRALKTLCRVGTAREWRSSRSHAAAWEAGGGERFTERRRMMAGGER